MGGNEMKPTQTSLRMVLQTARTDDPMQLSRVWQHMASTHNIHLTCTEEYDIKTAALDDYDAERIKQGNRIMRLEADAAGDRARCDIAEKETDALREALAELNDRLIDRQQTLMETLIENRNLRRELDKAMHYNQ
jgi:hypothetical protein